MIFVGSWRAGAASSRPAGARASGCAPTGGALAAAAGRASPRRRHHRASQECWAAVGAGQIAWARGVGIRARDRAWAPPSTPVLTPPCLHLYQVSELINGDGELVCRASCQGPGCIPGWSPLTPPRSPDAPPLTAAYIGA